MTTVLVGVDASERSLDAIAFARQLASASGASVLVANTFLYESRPSRMADRAYRDAIEGDALATVRRMAAELGHLGEAVVSTAVIARTSAAHGMHDLVEENHPDLLVVGSSHVGAAGRVMPGSTGERLLHGASCPVAVVPRHYRDRDHELRRLGVAYDGSDESAVALRAAAEIARVTGAELCVIRVMDPLMYVTPRLLGAPIYVLDREEIEVELRAELDEAVSRLPAGVSAQAVFTSGDPAHALAVQSGALDVLVVGSRGYGPLRAVMAGAVTGRLLRDAACPVIVLPRGVDSPLGRLFARDAEVPA